jgi:hypothetical protein
MNNNGHSATAGAKLREQTVYHPVIRAMAKIISIIFHPLFVPVYILLFFLYVSPLTIGLDAQQKGRLTISFSMMYILFPLVTVLLAKALGFINSIHLRTQKDRIIPYIASGIYYFWMWWVLHNQPGFPQPLVILSLAIFIASSGGLLLNSYFKISMHGISVGVGSTFIYLLAVLSASSFGIYLSIALLIAGLVLTSRLINDDHNPKEVYAGFFLGVLAQLVAFWVA